MSNVLHNKKDEKDRKPVYYPQHSSSTSFLGNIVGQPSRLQWKNTSTNSFIKYNQRMDRFIVRESGILLIWLSLQIDVKNMGKDTIYSACIEYSNDNFKCTATIYKNLDAGTIQVKDKLFVLPGFYFTINVDQTFLLNIPGNSNIIVMDKSFNGTETQIQEYKQSLLKQIETLHEENPKQYWQLIDELQGKEKDDKSALVAPFDWLNHFKNLTEPKDEFKERLQFLEEKLNILEKRKCFNELDSRISETEISTALSSLKINKAAGLDNISNTTKKNSYRSLTDLNTYLY
ncbi:unnamed protein product [Mytilus edulis]|uniref:Uncharacterized protein n=1 Tax=Mytilus edulis TaxID=6550 RepID=A0A8S3R436_MYTED|nr:unnamed protein product [Mytilus edulis]